MLDAPATYASKLASIVAAVTPALEGAPPTESTSPPLAAKA